MSGVPNSSIYAKVTYPYSDDVKYLSFHTMMKDLFKVIAKQNRIARINDMKYKVPEFEMLDMVYDLNTDIDMKFHQFSYEYRNVVTREFVLRIVSDGIEDRDVFTCYDDTRGYIQMLNHFARDYRHKIIQLYFPNAESEKKIDALNNRITKIEELLDLTYKNILALHDKLTLISTTIDSD